MDELEALSNKGIGFIRVDGNSEKEEKTLIVLGVARGGTSLIAGSLAQMGVYMGSAGKPVFEDVRLANAFEKRNFKEAKRIIEEYNRSHAVWGFKRPSSISYAKRLVKYTRNPVLLIIFKDLFAIANRNRISMKLGLIPGLNKAMKDYSDIIRIINRRYCDMYLFSYEKVMNNKTLLIEELAKVASVECTEEVMKKVSDFIEPDSPHYLKNTRINRVSGKVDRHAGNVVSGWATISHRKKAAEVELHINGACIQTTTADLDRPDIKAAGLHPTGRCGFRFVLEKEKHPGPSDSVQVMVVNDDLREKLPDPS